MNLAMHSMVLLLLMGPVHSIYEAHLNATPLMILLDLVHLMTNFGELPNP